MKIQFSNCERVAEIAVVRAGLGLLLAMVATTAAHAQTLAKCPTSKALTLDQVVGFVDQKVPEAWTIELIESCRVSFGMHVAAIDRLENAGTSEKVLEALNRVTASQLTLDEARSEVQELELHTSEIDKAVDAERDEALRKLEAEYQARRERGAQNDPKGEFESS